MTSPRVSVIIPTYNGNLWLSQAIDSVISQTFKDFEIIIIDDGSTEPIINNFQNEPRLLFIRQENAGTSAARNRGISISRGDYIAFLDHDDLWLPNKLQKQVNLLDKYSQVGFTFCDYISLCNDTSRPNGFSRGTISKLSVDEPEAGVFLIKNETVFNYLLDDLFVQIPSTWMIRRKILLDTGGFNSLLRRGGEDIYLALILSTRCKFAFHGAPMTQRREFPQSLSAKNNWKEEFLLTLDIIYKQQNLGPLEQQILFKRRKKFAENLARDDIATGNYGKAIKKLSIALEGKQSLNRTTLANYLLLVIALIKNRIKKTYPNK